MHSPLVWRSAPQALAEKGVVSPEQCLVMGAVDDSSRDGVEAQVLEDKDDDKWSEVGVKREKKRKDCLGEE